MRMAMVLASSALVVESSAAGAQSELVTRCDSAATLSPAYVTHDTAGSSVAAKFALARGATRAWLGGALPVLTTVCGAFRGTAAARAAVNPDDIKAAFSARALVALARDDPPPPPNPANPLAEPQKPTSLDFGFLSLGGSIGAQSNQRGTEALVSVGGVMVYTHNKMAGAWSLVPHVQAAFSGTRMVRSALRDAVNAAQDVEGLWDITGEWFIPIDKLSIVPRIRYFDKLGVDARAAAVEATSGAHYSVTAAVSVTAWLVRSVFVEWSKGALPVKSDRRHAVLLGVVTGR